MTAAPRPNHCRATVRPQRPGAARCLGPTGPSGAGHPEPPPVAAPIYGALAARTSGAAPVVENVLEKQDNLKAKQN